MPGSWTLERQLPQQLWIDEPLDALRLPARLDQPQVQ